MRLRDVSFQERFQHIEPVPGPFHMKMNASTNILKNYYGTPNVNAAETLWTHTKVLKRKHVSLDKSQMYKPTLELIQISLFARVLDCWKHTLGVDMLSAYATKKPTFNDMWKKAEILVDTYANSLALSRAQKKPIDSRDEVYESSCLFIRDALFLIEACAAVKAGDSGRLNLVRRFWTFSFWGAGSHNYGSESFYLEQNLRYEWSPAMREAYMNNCLYNTKGRANCWVEPDLVQEHVNFWIKVCNFTLSLHIFRPTPG